MTESFTHVEIHFGTAPKTASLVFKLRDHGAAQRWARCLHRASTHSQLLEKDRWYNFPNHKYGSSRKIAQQINESIAKLNELHPGLITQWADENSVQQSVNELHTHFADSHLVLSQITEQSDPYWRDFNNHLHAFEAWERNEALKAVSGQNETCSIVFTWVDNQKQPLQEEDYSHFTVAKKFGTCYVNYCQVGRHFFELFQSQDTHAKDEHILPLRSLSADTYLWLGSTTGKKSLEKRELALKEWFHAHQERFQRLGHHWGDPKLALGWLPVADLQTSVTTPSEKEEFLEWLSSFREISGCRCF